MRSNIPKGSSTKIQKKVTVFDISSDTSDDDEEPLLRPILISTAKTSNRMNTGIIPKQEADQSPGTPTSNQKKRKFSVLNLPRMDTKRIPTIYFRRYIFFDAMFYLRSYILFDAMFYYTLPRCFTVAIKKTKT